MHLINLQVSARDFEAVLGPSTLPYHPTWQQKEPQLVLFIWHYFLSLFIGKG
jgi:hypothetical protein